MKKFFVCFFQVCQEPCRAPDKPLFKESMRFQFQRGIFGDAFLEAQIIMSLLHITKYGRVVSKGTRTVIIYILILGPTILSTCDPGITLLSKSTGKEAIAIKYPEFKAEINSGFLMDGPVTIGIEIWTTEEIMIFPDRLLIVYRGRDIYYNFTRDYKSIGNGPFYLNDSKCLLIYTCGGLRNLQKMDEIQISADNFFLKGDNFYDIDTVTFYSPKGLR